MRKAFTLTELLLVIAIIGIMAGLALSAINGAVELSREQRTRSIISKIDQLIAEKYEGYRTRAVPLKLPAGISPITAGQIRLYALRDIMRMELPERVSDLVDGPATLYTSGSVTLKLAQPSAFKSYRRCATRACGASWATAWTQQYQGSECLYLIVSTFHDGDKNALDFFLPEEVGDTDGDGMKEILDGWGRPIEFLRWAPGYTIENAALTTQTSAYTSQQITLPDGTKKKLRLCQAPDPFDPLHTDPHWDITTGTAYPANFGLRPLIISAGRDKQYDVATRGVDASGNAFRYATTSPLNDPYFVPSVSGQYSFGTPVDFDGDGLSGDNITNHYLVAP